MRICSAGEQFEPGAGEFVLHMRRAAPNSPPIFSLTSVLGEGQSQRAGLVGDADRRCDVLFTWNGRSGVIIGSVAGASGRRICARQERAVARHGGQERTHFGCWREEVRTAVALQFWEGDWIGGRKRGGVDVAHNLPRPATMPPRSVRGTADRPIEMQDATRRTNSRCVADAENGRENRLLVDGSGWYTFQKGWWNTGTWVPIRSGFHHGFTPISEAAHAARREDVWFRTGARDGRLVAVGAPSGVLIGTNDTTNCCSWQREAGNGLWSTSENHAKGIDTIADSISSAGLWRGHDAETGGITRSSVTGTWRMGELRRSSEALTTRALGGEAGLETLRRAGRCGAAISVLRRDAEFTYGLALWVPYSHGFQFAGPLSSDQMNAGGIGRMERWMDARIQGCWAVARWGAV